MQSPFFCIVAYIKSKYYLRREERKIVIEFNDEQYHNKNY